MKYPLILSIIILIDLVSTLIILLGGYGTEGNPLMLWVLIKGGYPLFIFTKLMLLIIVLVVIESVKIKKLIIGICVITGILLGQRNFHQTQKQLRARF